MPQYDYIDDALVGSLQGLDNHVEGGWSAFGGAIEYGTPVFAEVGEAVRLTPFSQGTGQVNVGFAVRTQNATGQYEQYDAVNVLTRGRCVVQCTTACQANAKVHVDATGKVANAGEELNARFRGSLAGAGNVEVEFYSPTTLL